VDDRLTRHDLTGEEWQRLPSRTAAGTQAVAGITAAKIAPMLISSTITPKPEMNSAANSTASTSGSLPWASGQATSGAVNSRQPSA
jgi:hypothetical protein